MRLMFGQTLETRLPGVLCYFTPGPGSLSEAEAGGRFREKGRFLTIS